METEINILSIESDFIMEDDRLAALPETEEFGNPFTICTNGAKWLKEKYFPTGKIMGYSIDKNPSAEIGKEIYGHDFIFIDNKYIVDFWYKNICGKKEAPIILDIHRHKELVQKYYGDLNTWEELK